MTHELAREFIPIVDAAKHAVLMTGKEDSSEDTFLKQSMLLARLARTAEFIIDTSGKDIFDHKSTILDVGDSSGCFLNFFCKNGTALNVDKQTCNFLNSRNIKCLQKDIQSIPHECKFDYVFAFEIIEHVSNPIAALQSLGSVVNRLLFISIPLLGNQTRIKPFGYWDTLGRSRSVLKSEAHRHHVFEFSPTDFHSIITHAALKVVAYEECFNFYPADPRFQLYALEPIEDNPG